MTEFILNQTKKILKTTSELIVGDTTSEELVVVSTPYLTEGNYEFIVFDIATKSFKIRVDYKNLQYTVLDNYQVGINLV